jgi:hypothetical protein
MELYLSSNVSGRRTHIPLITEAAAVVQDDQGREIASFETVPGNPVAALLAFLDRYPRAELHAVHRDADRILFLSSPWNLADRLWGESVVTAARDVMERMDTGAGNKSGCPAATLKEAARVFGVQGEGPSGSLAAARLGARLHAVVRDRRAACDLEEDEVIHMMEQGL